MFSPYTKADDACPDVAACVAEIKAVLKRHGMAGAACIASATHTQILVDFPPWSMIQMLPHSNDFNVRFNGPGCAQSRASVQMLLSLAADAAQLSDALEKMDRQITQTLRTHGVDIERLPTVPDTAQNN